METEEQQRTPRPVVRLWRLLRRERRRRPVSFYLLLLIPLVMLLGLHLLVDRSDPKRMALGLTLFLVFFGVLMVRAVMDMFEISRRRLHDQRSAFRDTIGEAGFTEELGRRVRAERAEYDRVDESDWLDGG